MPTTNSRVLWRFPFTHARRRRTLRRAYSRCKLPPMMASSSRARVISSPCMMRRVMPAVTLAALHSASSMRCDSSSNCFGMSDIARAQSNVKTQPTERSWPLQVPLGKCSGLRITPLLCIQLLLRAQECPIRTRCDASLRSISNEAEKLLWRRDLDSGAKKAHREAVSWMDQQVARGDALQRAPPSPHSRTG